MQCAAVTVLHCFPLSNGWGGLPAGLVGGAILLPQPRQGLLLQKCAASVRWCVRLYSTNINGRGRVKGVGVERGSGCNSMLTSQSPVVCVCCRDSTLRLRAVCFMCHWKGVFPRRRQRHRSPSPSKCSGRWNHAARSPAWRYHQFPRRLQRPHRHSKMF